MVLTRTFAARHEIENQNSDDVSSVGSNTIPPADSRGAYVGFSLDDTVGVFISESPVTRFWTGGHPSPYHKMG